MDTPDNIGAVFLIADCVITAILLLCAVLTRKKDRALSKVLLILGLIFAVFPMMVLMMWLAAVENS